MEAYRDIKDVDEAVGVAGPELAEGGHGQAQHHVIVIVLVLTPSPWRLHLLSHCRQRLVII